MYLFILLIAFLATFNAPPAAASLLMGSYHYLEKKDTTYSKIKWTLEKEDYYKLTVIKQQEEFVCLCNEHFDTYQWEAKKPYTRTHVTATRKDNLIFIEGAFDGKEIKKEIRIDNAPWYQAMTLSLRRLVTSKEKSVEFWTIRFDNLSPYKMKAKNNFRDRISLYGTEDMEVEKVKVSLMGFKAMFWNCSYWFRKQDGLFVRFEGRGGPPDYPKTIIELAEDEKEHSKNPLSTITQKN